MSIETFLKQREIKNPIDQYKEELQQIVEGTGFFKLFKKKKLSKKAAALGLELIKKNKSGYYGNAAITLGSSRAEVFKNLIPEKIWDIREYYDLLIYFFGEEKAVYVKYAWEQMPYKIYQSSYLRRSFRAPNDENFAIINQVNFLINILQPLSKYDYKTGKTSYYNLNMEEHIAYTHEFYGNDNFYIWSAAIDLNNEKIFRLLEEIIQNKSETGKVSRECILALLNAKNKAGWLLVEKLLLAAQRQEGLRQVIVEALDEANVEALKYMIDVILEHKLTRFSSIVRAVDVWTGLGWEAEKESTIKTTLQFAKEFLNHPEKIAQAIKSTNNIEVYMALWAQGVVDVDKTAVYLQELLDKGTIEKKCLALKFASELYNPAIEMPLYYQAVKEPNLQILAFCFKGMNPLLNANAKSEFYINNDDFPAFFDQLDALLGQISEKEKVFDGKVFSWLKAKFNRNDIYEAMILLVGQDRGKLDRIMENFSEMAISLRESLTRNILKDFYQYSFSYGEKNNKNIPSDFQREFAFKLLKDRGEAIVATAINTLKLLKLNEKELNLFFELFKRKGATLRMHLIDLILKQDDEQLNAFMANLLTNGDSEQRMAGLELMIKLKEASRLLPEIENWTAAFNKRAKISEKEQKIIRQLSDHNETAILSAANGYGLYDPEKISPFALPVIEEDSYYKKAVKENKYGFSKPLHIIKSDLEQLSALYLNNKEYEYTSEDYYGKKEKILLGNRFSPTRYSFEGLSLREKYECYPLFELWEKWYLDSKLQPVDLFLLTFAERNDRKAWREILENEVFYFADFIPNPDNSRYQWNNPISKILVALGGIYPFEEKNKYLVDACIQVYSKLPDTVLKYKRNQEQTSYYSWSHDEHEYGSGWQAERCFNVFLNGIELKPDDELAKKVWNLYRWKQYSGLAENIGKNVPPLYIFSRAYEQHLVTKDELISAMLLPNRIQWLSADKKNNRDADDVLKDFPFVKPFFETIREYLLDIELKRKSSATPVTIFAQNLKKIYGINRFKELLTGLGKASLYKGYIYSWSGSEMNKQQLFTSLLKKCFPLPADNQDAFNAAMRDSGISENRLIEAAVYAPQWQQFISNYLGWNGLDEAIWWMHAHTKTAAYQQSNAEDESEIAKYSTLDVDDFKDGAVDKEWFDSAYKKLGKKRWELVYNAARYISEGNGHRRARLYADTILGDLKIREVTAKVKDKRDQDYLRVYGLVPLSKTNSEKDVLGRYLYLQQFKKESRDFGAQRQASEALAIRVAMENLARNAGYPDPIRLTWAMETKQVLEILSDATEIKIDDIVLNLVVDSDGKADVEVFKEGKMLKSIPAKYKKEKSVLALNEHKKVLREQFSRSRKGLEEAMIRGDEFHFEEMEVLIQHPVIAGHLQKLVFVLERESAVHIGFYHKGNLVDFAGELYPIQKEETIRIAHCYDLHASGTWREFQHYCFEKELVQPFKQIFRELYVPTADELAVGGVSGRYEGHQVQPKKTVALLKSRGWKVDYETGLQKLYRKEGYTVKLYAMADWFTPSDVESPTLETVEFHDLKTYKNIPFSEIDPRIFSEVMRDIDLVVSVAHVGGVDPESSHSTIEMRAVILEESIRLFKLGNVEVKGSHVMINGTYGTYSLHLGSAVVHQLPGRYLSILPVHSQHRGRLFLPFLDEDPKTSEIIAKVLLLSRDKEIQDPTVLSQIEMYSN